MRLVLLALIPLFLLSSEALCQTKALSLDEARAIALSQSYLVKQIDRNFAQSLSEAINLKTGTNPELETSYGVQVKGSREGVSEPIEVSLSQSLKPSMFGSRPIVAALLEKAGSNELKSELFELSERIGLRFARTWAAQERLRSVQGARVRAKRQVQIVKESAAKGILGLGEEWIFLAEEKKLAAELLGAEADLDGAKSELLQQLGEAQVEGPLLRPGNLAKVVIEHVFASSNESSFSRESRAFLSAKLAREQAKLAQEDSRPGFRPKLFYERSDDRKDFVGVGVSIELPVSNRNQAEILRTEAEAVSQQALKTYLKGEGYREELSRLSRSVNALIDQALQYEREVIPAFQKALRVQQKQFSAGSGSLLQIWQTQRELTEAERAFLELWLKAYAARSELSILVGTSL